jgi:hypothetical protein
MPPLFPLDLTTEANNARFDSLHPNRTVCAIGSDNNGRLPPLDETIYSEVVASEVEFAISVVMEEQDE